MDEAFYEGTITEFDPWRHRHTIAYDDGDIELVALWAPHEVVRFISVLVTCKNGLTTPIWQ